MSRTTSTLRDTEPTVVGGAGEGRLRVATLSFSVGLAAEYFESISSGRCWIRRVANRRRGAGVGLAAAAATAAAAPATCVASAARTAIEERTIADGAHLRAAAGPFTT